jgi:DNA-directed RNA polymerase specialized sigma24 family protein
MPSISLSSAKKDAREESGEPVHDGEAKQRLRDLYVTVLAVAMKLTHSKAQAEDLTQTVFERLASTRPLEADVPREEAVRHALGVLKSVLSAERASARSQRERERIVGGEWAAASTAGHSAEVLSLERARRERDEGLASRRVAALRARLAGHPLELAVLDRMQDDVTKAAAIAEELERPVKDIYEALARIRRYMKSIVAAEGGHVEEVESWPG